MNAYEHAEKASEVFVLSDSFIRIKELIDNESSTIDDIADVILLDPALSGTILKLANSSFFNYPGKIDTISKAVLVLGITEVYNLVIAFFTKEALKNIVADEDYLDNFWSRSVDCALLVKYIGMRTRMPNVERLFILGLLHNLGELVVQQVSPEKVYACRTLPPPEMPWEKQQRVLGFSFGECTAELLKQWQLPFTLIEPIRNQDDDNFEYCNDECKLLYIAKRIMLLNHECKAHIISGVVTDEVMKNMGIDQETLQAASNYCDLERLGILSVLNPGASMVY
jgi:HD-like signal output (HDOD) protein